MKKEEHFRLYWNLHLHVAPEPNELLPFFLLQISADIDFCDDYSIDDSKHMIFLIHTLLACDPVLCK